MLEVLPNLRTGLLVFSSMFMAFSVVVIVFTARSKRVQSGQYVFLEGQWAAMCCLLAFGILFAFALSMPGPPQRPFVLAEARSELVQENYKDCVQSYRKMGQYLDNVGQQECVNTARFRADTALGLKTPTRVIQLPAPAAPAPVTRTLYRIRQIDHRVGQRARAEKYTLRYNACLANLTTSDRKPNTQQMDWCDRLAVRQTDASYRAPHQDIVTPLSQPMEAIQ